MESGSDFQKGKAFDLWSIPHFLYGILIGMLPPLIHISVWTAFSLLLILGLLWEVYEKIIGVKESALNIIFDFILPITSFMVTSYVIVSNTFYVEDILVIEIAFFLVYVYTNLSGWRAYRRRKKEFMG